MNQLMTLISRHDCELTLRALDWYIKSYDLDPEDKMQANALANWIRLQLAKSEFQNNFKSKDKV